MKNGRFAAPLAAAVLAIAPALAPHITPTVELVKQAVVIRQTLAGATRFYARTVTIGKEDLRKLKQLGDYVPEDPDVEFFYGQDPAGTLVGVVLFPQVNTMQHGPIELGLTIGPDGKVASAVVTKATVETKPWVEEVIRAGFLRNFAGLPASTPADRSAKISNAGLSSMPAFMGGVITQAVNQGIALYQVLFAAQ